MLFLDQIKLLFISISNNIIDASKSRREKCGSCVRIVKFLEIVENLKIT